MKISLKSIGNKLLSIAFWMCVPLMVYLLLSVFCLASFKIPSDSMEPVLLPGDHVLVNKLDKGARLFSLKAAMNGERFNIRRLPGFHAIQRNDVLVFNFPYPANKNAIRFDLMQYYAKRCIAIPGDTLEIQNGYFRIRGTEVMWKNREAQQYLSERLRTDTTGVVLRAYPKNPKLGWTVKELGPFPIPQANQTIQMNEETASLYRRVIEWEQGKELQADSGAIYLGDSLITHYRFAKNYYFVAGDKLQSSNDSRYWGLLPEEFIVGKATLIWKSTDPVTRQIRWDRLFKSIH